MATDQGGLFFCNKGEPVKKPDIDPIPEFETAEEKEVRKLNEWAKSGGGWD